jgi:thiosulfate reductase cytochrome b subunit
LTRAAFWRAWSVWAVTMAITTTAISYDALHPLPASLADQGGNSLDMAVGLTFIAAFATVGALLTWKKPRNPIGWLLSASGLAYALGSFSQRLIHFHRTRTLGHWLGWTWLLGLGLCVFIVLLFPAGRLPSRRWRTVGWAAGAGLAGWVLGNAFAPTITRNDPPVPNPVGVTGAPGKIFTVMVGASLALIAVTGLAAVLSLVFRYQRARAGERAQLRWLVYAGALIVVAFLAEMVAERIIGPGTTATNLQNAVSSGGGALIPAAIGIAVLRYRLYDIDRIISRTVAYAIVTGLLVGAYAGLVLLATHVLRVHTPVAVAVATLAAAALFTPVRRWVQSRVDRRFNRVRYDADQIAAAFAARLKDTVDLSSVRDDLTGIVSRALEPAHLSVWISRHQGPS